MWQQHCRKCKKKKKCFGNCGNGIAENEKKKFVLAIMAMALHGKKNFTKSVKVKKKKLSCPQYFHNKSHMINYY